ncbi:MAG: DUF1080 domain-containing protein [Armatimonadota bacterium]|nr:DUF1080 domain-containing protein [Armatimonadota bacterium]
MSATHPSSRWPRWIVTCSLCLVWLLGLAGLVSCGYSDARAGKRLFSGSEAVPADAIVLFDGKDLSQWTYMNSRAADWKIESGYMQVRGGSIRTKQEFAGDYQLHVEFCLPLMADVKGQDRANSGVYLNSAYEVQVLDSYDLPEIADGDCGAIYSIATPIANACRPPETWQSYDIIFHSPKMDKDGKKIANARMTVLQNGVLIHHNTEVPYPTGSHDAPDAKKGNIELQDHGCKVRYRNVWLRQL